MQFTRKELEAGRRNIAVKGDINEVCQGLKSWKGFVRYKDYTKLRSGQKQVDILTLRRRNEVCLDQD